MEVREIRRDGNNAVGTIAGGATVMLRARSLEIGSNSATALTDEDSQVVVRSCASVIQDGELGETFLTPQLKITTKLSKVLSPETAQLVITEVREWYAREQCGEHIVVEDEEVVE